jgi:hypothetical protein
MSFVHKQNHFIHRRETDTEKKTADQGFDDVKVHSFYNALI